MQPTTVLFGAFDRHNFGDLLFPHIAAALLPGRALAFAGLAERDLRSQGGHAVAALERLIERGSSVPIHLIHVGGEILTCSAWQAAVMLLPPEEAQRTIAYLEPRSAERMSWVRAMVGSSVGAPYAVSRLQHPSLARVVFAGVGGVALEQADAALHADVLAKLRAADAVGVRDRQTLAHLANAGIAARLMPDPAVMVAELFGERIHQQAQGGEVARVRRAFARGYLAVQFSAEWRDDASLRQIAAQLDAVTAQQGVGVVLFRAGAAPWHDDWQCLTRVAAWMRPGAAQVFESLHLWDICALIAHSRGFCGSSLHGRIVAMAFALPRVHLRPSSPMVQPGKQAAFATTWDNACLPAGVDLHDLGAGIHTALGSEKAALAQHARWLAGLYRQEFAALCTALA